MPKKELTQRYLLSLLVDVQTHLEGLERVKAQVEALAKEHGVVLPRG